MTFNVHKLLHLKGSVDNLGPLWSHSCFFFEDLNGDFSDLFNGTQNSDGQVKIYHTLSVVFCPTNLHVCCIISFGSAIIFVLKIVQGVSIMQKMLELASSICHPEVQHMCTKLTHKNHYKRYVHYIVSHGYMEHCYFISDTVHH